MKYHYAGSHRILVVDDTPSNLKLILATLSSAGYDVLTATSGAQALTVLQMKLPDLVLLDVHMPAMDGFETCRRIKANADTAHIPIIFLTAFTDTEKITAGFSLGAVDFMTKPVHSVELLARVKNHLKLHGLTQTLEQQVVERTTALQALEVRQRTLFDLSPIGLVLCRMDGSLVDVNAAYAAILGRTIGETLTLTIGDITPQTYAHDDRLQLENLKKMGRYGPYEKDYLHRDGHLVPVRLSGILIDQGGEQFIWSCVEDISDRKHIETEREQLFQELFRVNAKLKQANQKLENYSQTLEQRVDERTIALQESEQRLQTLVAGTAAITGKDFFPALVQHISSALEVSIALVTQFVDQELQSLAFMMDGELQPNFTYALSDTPCVKLATDYSYQCLQGLSQHFPNHPHRARGMDSYLGVALRDRQGQVLGSLCIFDRQPFQNPERAQQILNIFGSRAAAELERQRIEKALQNLVAGSAITAKADFFPVLVRYLTEALGVSHALMAERLGDEEIPLAYYADGKLMPPQSLPLLNTPSAEVYKHETYYCELTPCQTCAKLAQMGARSYLGVALKDRQGKAMGLLAIFHRQILSDPVHAEQILQVFAARAAAELERQRAENALQNLIAGTAALTGPDFFNALVCHIAEALHASHAFVTELVDDTKLNFVAAWGDGQHLPTEIVDIEGTTCAIAIRLGAYHCERDVIACFPQNPRLAPMGVESYMGVALKNRQGKSLGTLCIFSRQLIANAEHSLQILQVFAARAAAELERQRAEHAMEQLNRELERRVRDRTAQLTASEDRLKTLFDQSADAVFLLGEQQGFIDCNQAAVELLRYPSKAELLALNPLQISPERQPDGQRSSTKVKFMIEEAIQRCCFRFEWVHQRSDQEIFWAEITLTPIKYQDEIIFHCITRDISDRKQAEEKLRQSMAQLETSNNELEAFAYSISHDLRAPLRAINGFSQALLEDYGDLFDEEGQYFFERIRANTNRMGDLIDDLLRLSRVSRSELSYNTVDLSTLAQEVLHDLQKTEPERQVDISVTPGLQVFADTALMQVVLMNLLQNAWKFTHHHPTARIEFGILAAEAQDFPTPVYFVKDDGAGFDMAYSHKLFGVFQRLHSVEEFSGTGIGLATVQRAIHRHGGQVWADAGVEQGATFFFTIPNPSEQPLWTRGKNESDLKFS
ncbi:PAS domain S-box protein [Leptothoe kymatousa]|uniref:histidine kinase n=1 Tax=Leptothoe kymatousa TAU-MAC 1615 TaxID=2364775 RepID=A0ABS5Y4D1_9CYAN|nr:PAS domain S-box protein [Leptothoe kymatousa]MBT9312693.1 PAS domain S-box protein [Leptothoe kymatousa TAU-MAC 1615]